MSLFVVASAFTISKKVKLQQGDLSFPVNREKRPNAIITSLVSTKGMPRILSVYAMKDMAADIASFVSHFFYF